MMTSTDLAGLRAALRLVQRDIDGFHRADGRGGVAQAADDDGGASPPGAVGEARFHLVGTEQGVFVALPDGRFWPAGSGPLPAGAEKAAAVVAVATRAQECLAEILWHSWPRCPDHDGVLRAAAEGDDAVWRCDAADHQVARIGRLAESVPSRRSDPDE